MEYHIPDMLRDEEEREGDHGYGFPVLIQKGICERDYALHPYWWHFDTFEYVENLGHDMYIANYLKDKDRLVYVHDYLLGLHRHFFPHRFIWFFQHLSEAMDILGGEGVWRGEAFVVDPDDENPLVSYRFNGQLPLKKYFFGI